MLYITCIYPTLSCTCQSNMHDTLQQKPQAGKFVKISDKQEEVLLMVLLSSQSFSSALQPYHGTGVVLILVKTFWTWILLPHFPSSLRNRPVQWVLNTSSIHFGGLCFRLSISPSVWLLQLMTGGQECFYVSKRGGRAGQKCSEDHFRNAFMSRLKANCCSCAKALQCKVESSTMLMGELGQQRQ